MTELPLIPLPNSLKLGGESITGPLDARIDLSTLSKQLRDQVSILLQHLKIPGVEVRGDHAESTPEAPGTVLSVEVDDQMDHEEGYELDLAPGNSVLRASGYAGFVWGLQTLRQILQPHGDIPSLKIKDSPRFDWRGMHLDVARHFFSVEFIMKFLDLMSRHKLNRFHWHLTDDQGWRLEIPAYPLLTEVGAWRRGPDGSGYGGYYTRQEVSRIVEHARMLGITVVPEIDLPGHASAALAAYPEMACKCKLIEVPTTWGILDNTLCPGRRATYGFVRDILQEVAGLFHGTYVHIGGDECPTSNWESHSHCQTLMKREGMSNPSQLQGYFNIQVAEILHSMDRKLIGWDEILETGAPRGFTVMCWRDWEFADRAVKSGHQVVLTPMSHCYFDFYQAQEGEPKAIGGFLPLEQVYEFDPLGSTVLKNHSHLVLGGQANIWTEYMETSDHVEYMTVPRICALSETLWSATSDRDFSRFRRRLAPHVASLSDAGYHHRPMK